MTAALILLLFSATGLAAEKLQLAADQERSIAELQAGHISANEPSEASFMALLQRDVRAYLAARRLPSKNVEIEALRKGATQSGVSFPKYYLWIIATDETGHRVEGAMRVAAIERVRFEITDFTSVDSIRSDPSSLAAIYPAALISAIREHAGAE